MARFSPLDGWTVAAARMGGVAQRYAVVRFSSLFGLGFVTGLILFGVVARGPALSGAGGQATASIPAMSSQSDELFDAWPETDAAGSLVERSDGGFVAPVLIHL